MEQVGRAIRGDADSSKGLEPRDVAAILGLSRSRGPLRVWERATNSPFAFASPSEREELRWKHRLEPLVVERYQAETRGIVSIRKRIVPAADLEAPFLFADMQHRISGPENVGVSFKILRTARGYGSASRPEASPEAWAESQVLLWMTGFEAWDVAALIAGVDLQVYRVHADREAQTFIVDYAADWYRRHVTGGEKPEDAAGAAALAWANQAFSMRAAAPIMEADPEAESLADSYFRAAQAIELLEMVRQASARGLYLGISEGAVLRGNDWSARLDRQSITNHEALAGLCLEKLSEVGAFENGLTVQGLFDQASRFVPSKLVVERSVVDE